ncbi:T9SS type A sorting domain-containing protein [bacterium]|nr:T9SS type A sorting domain-containing protein [bacterium]
MKLYVTVVLVLMANILFSQTMWDNALPIRQAGDLEWNQSSITTEDNEIVHVWSESNYGIGDILAMKFDNEGNSLWGQDPIVVADSDNHQTNAKIINTNDGGFVIVWMYYNEYNNHHEIRAQKLDSSGNRLWSDEGAFISDQYNDNVSNRLVLFPNEVGGAIISWVDYSTMAQSLDSNGLVQWGQGGLNVGYTYYSNQITSDGNGGLIVVDIPENEDTMFYKRIDASGVVLWSEEIALDTPGDNPTTMRLIYNNIDSYYLMTEEVNYTDIEIAVRKLSLTGELDSTVTNIPIMHNLMNPFLFEYTTNASGELFIVSQSKVNLSDDEISLHAFKLDQNLDHVWSETGELLDSFITYVYHSTKIEATDSGDLFVINVQDGIEEPSAVDYHVHLYSINTDGTIQTDPEGFLIYQDENIFPSLSLNYEDDLFIVWTEITDGFTNLRQMVLNDELQTVTPEDSELVRHSLTGSIYMDNYKSYTLPNSESTVLIWLDKKTLMNNKIKYQIVNSDGSVEFAENGIDIADFTIYGDYDYGYEPISLATSQNELGQICVAWTSGYGFGTRSRIIDTDGSLLGSETGQEICPLQDTSGQIGLFVSSYNNEFYASWMVYDYFESTTTAYSAKTTNSTEWGDANLVASFYGTQFYTYDLIEAISNYMIIEEDDNLYKVFKTTDNGTVSEIDQIFTGYDYKFDCDSDNNLFFTWQNVEKIYLQGITDDNQLFWNNPVLVSYHPENQDIVQAYSPHILISEGVNILWSQNNNDINNELRAQKISYSGDRMWNEQGVLVTIAPDYFNVSFLENINDDHIVAGWREMENYSFVHRVKILNNAGNSVYDENSSNITGINNGYSTIKITKLPDNKSLFTWINGGGLYAQLLDFTTVDNESNNIAPMIMSLMQNYPNPFNPETNISFQVPNYGQVRVDIYNIKGQKVKSLVNDRFNAGRHSVVWNGKDDNNKQVASGIYLYKMRSGKYSSTKKMILMK